ncbi:MAG: hypothetical protein C0468_00990 [Planctomyces sp.]|nr:hypothetical protein [Planctomyces sp.]MBA4120595.1 hypothetical protein [Isosphaera sp.]
MTRLRAAIDGLLELLGGAYQLLRLAVLTRFRLRGAYWQWRWHTAFGRGAPLTRTARLRAALDYGKWVHRMRRGTRP